MATSISGPIGAAIERAQRVLFQPFDLPKWLGLGLCAFLVQLGEGSGASSGFNWTNTGGDGERRLREVVDWVSANESLVLGLACALVVVILLLTALLQWLGSRGTLMFIDGIARNRGAVKEPWARYRAEANRLFVVRFVLSAAAIAVAVAAAVGILMQVWPHLVEEEASRIDVGVVVAIVGAALIPGLAILLTTWLLDHFVAPALYLRGGGVRDAWRAAREEVLAGHAGTVVVYFLTRCVLAFVVWMCAAMLTCMTCCIAALPYVGAVLLLPLTVFLRAHNLLFLEQFGERWRFIQPEQPETEGAWR